MENPPAQAASAPYRRRRPSRRRPHASQRFVARRCRERFRSERQAAAPRRSRDFAGGSVPMRRSAGAKTRRNLPKSLTSRARISRAKTSRRRAPRPRSGQRQNGAELPREPEFGDGIIEISGKGFGFLRDAKRNFVQTPNDIFVTPEIVRRFQLRDGMWISRRNPQRQSRPATDSSAQDQRRRADQISGPPARSKS